MINKHACLLSPVCFRSDASQLAPRLRVASQLWRVRGHGGRGDSCDPGAGYVASSFLDIDSGAISSRPPPAGGSSTCHPASALPRLQMPAALRSRSPSAPVALVDEWSLRRHRKKERVIVWARLPWPAGGPASRAGLCAWGSSVTVPSRSSTLSSGGPPSGVGTAGSATRASAACGSYRPRSPPTGSTPRPA